VQQGGTRSLASCIKDILSFSNGPLALWRGTVPSTLRTGFGSAVYFTTLNSLRQRARSLGFTEPPAQLSNYSSALPTLTKSANLVTGAAARTFAGFVLMPLTVIKVRYESSLYSYRSILEAGSDILKNNGLRGFFSGVGATTIRDAPYAGLYVLFYEIAKKQLSASFHPSTDVNGGFNPTTMKDQLSAAINFSSGIMAGSICAVISNPFDAIKTRIQLQPQSYPNMLSTLFRMVSQEGLRSLWDGLALRMTRKALSSALAWTLYEEIIRAEMRWIVGIDKLSR
jgi:solute carrier family 25, member 38